MPYVCSRDGHFVEGDAKYCSEHGSRIFSRCPGCGEPWTAMPGTLFDEVGSNFCYVCSYPAPWVSRQDRMMWIRDRLQEVELDPATRLELQEILDHLATMKPDDDKAFAGWTRIKDAAPRLLDIAKPVLESVISEAMKKMLGL